MGQRANSGRNAALDDKKERAAGRDQNSPEQQAITDRQPTPPVGGAFGKDEHANRDAGRSGTQVTGETSGSAGGDAGEEMERKNRSAN